MKNEFTAQILRSSADGVAGLATARLIEEHPEGLVDDFPTWKAQLKDWTLQLAAAIQSGNTQAFADHMSWSQVSMHSRGIPPSALIQALECLDEVACDSVPPGMVDELPPHLEPARQRLTQKVQPSNSCLSADEPFRTLAVEFIAALRSGDEPRATQSILEAQSSQGLSIEAVVDKVLGPSLREMGRLWHTGQATIAEEHFVTQATHKVLTRVIALAPKQAPNGKTAVLSCVQGEDHSFGIQVVSGYLHIAGWRTICLGANTPPTDVAEAAKAFGAHVVLLGASLDVQIHSVIDTVQKVRELSPGSKILVGGSAFDKSTDLWKTVGADHLAAHGQDAVRVANSC